MKHLSVTLLVVSFFLIIGANKDVAAPVFNVMDYGAKGDGKTLDTPAIQRTINLVKKQGTGGGTVYFPSGTFLTGALNLTSYLTFEISPGATLLAIQDMAHYPVLPAFPTYGVSRDTHGTVNRFGPVIGGYSLTNVVINGGGTIEGQGSWWWDLWANNKVPHSRPHLIEFEHTQHLTITNVHLRNSPFWTVHPIYCDDVHIHSISIFAPWPSPNTDGIDPDSTTNVVIENVDISCGDDMIAVKSGMRTPETTVFMPTRNVTVRNSVFGTGYGLSIGSETSGGIHDVFFINNTVRGAYAGPHLKSSRGRGGVIENIRYVGLHLEDVTHYAIIFGMNYDNIPVPGNKSSTPTLKDVLFQNITGSAGSAGQLYCLPESPCTNVNMLNVDIKAQHGFECEYIHGTSVRVTPQSCILQN